MHIAVVGIRILLAIVINVATFSFFGKVYKPKYDNKILYIAVFVFSCICMVLINQLNMYLLNFLYAVIGFNVICLILYDIGFKQSILYNMLYLTFLAFSDIFTTLIWLVISGKNLEQIISDVLIFIISCLLNIIVIIFIYKMFTVFLSKKGTISIRVQEIIFTLLLFISEFFILYVYVKKATSTSDGYMLVIMIAVFCLLNVYASYILEKLSNAYKLQYELDIMKRQNEMQIANYNEMILQYEKTRKIIHDMKKHLNVLNELNTKDSEAALKYKQKVEHEVDSLYMGFQASNKILGVIFSQKIEYAERNGIKVITDVEDLSFSFLSDIDITALFSNLWDNAIEACLKLGPEKRLIEFKIKKANDFILINVKNTFDGKINKHRNKILSTKPEHDGMGLSIIKSTVEKYRGVYNISYDDKYFYTEITIPI